MKAERAKEGGVWVGCVDYLKGLDPLMNQRKGFTPREGSPHMHGKGRPRRRNADRTGAATVPSTHTLHPPCNAK